MLGWQAKEARLHTYMYYKIIIILLSLLISAHLSAEKQITITLTADEWCPYNCMPTGKHTGYIVEAAEVIFESENISINYVTLPWSRALIETAVGDRDGIIGAGRDEAPDLIFPVLPMGVATHAIFTLPGDPWQFEDLSSLKMVTLGAIQDYSYGTLFDDYISLPENQSRIELVRGNQSLEQLVRMLKAGRVDAIVEDKNVLQYTLAREFPDIELEMKGVIATEEIFVAFTPASEASTGYATLLDSGLQSLRDSGELERILEKYNVEDWHTDND